MAQNSCYSQSNHLNDIKEGNEKQEGRMYEANAGEELDCNLQTPLMFSRCSSLGSLTGFEQHSVQDDGSSVISEFSPKTSRAASPLAFTPCKSYSTHKIDAQKNILHDNDVGERKTIPCQRLPMYTNVSFQYDVAFKKPHFLKHSVFEDDIAAFKDESSNPLSTAASSLSSLTIDDDDCNDNFLSSKAGLVKKRINAINILQNHQEYCRRDPIGSASEPIHSDEKCFSQRNIDKSTLFHDEPKFFYNVKNDQYSSNLQDISLRKNKNDFIKNQSQLQLSKKDKFVNTLQDNKENFMQHRIQLKPEDKEKKVYEDCHKSVKKQSNYIEENNDLNAYEEQLLDQCIRRGMAKVTKQKISDIKPFCWDLNHICLTTRAMLKIHDEEIMRDRKDERSKRRVSHVYQ